MTRTDLIAADHHGGGVTRPDALSHVVYRGLLCDGRPVHVDVSPLRCAARRRPTGYRA
ncbi:hypothetical protein OG920_06185 [Streptomyces europaeiscabiei]|uniref:hypothetical protein n=1 Tax=Streptomyces TaxID=1883 RepID=UPI0015C502D9|nr:MULTISPECIES: hypothetical protein [Streptomyces]MDX3585873.1 hypothetical protein [Streptomyces europaeiscabiei]MDX3619163.1 hypothetical protein [Streptomyces europaeiscabiei]MDX3636008.1 hypothetical protein [Streptomyces europaeiscabiei]MDX3654084.1 hypothetical protein [Streptomyces europaeiscabiei]WUD31035.1 hypothetical protein OG858_06235 [Streptomyces europaeiscabiei]